MCAAYVVGFAIFVCLIAWPIAIVVGWCIGDRNQVIVFDSMWTGPFPITNSPGFGLIVLTSLPHAAGAAMMLTRPRKKRGYLVSIATSLIAGILSFLLALSINSV